MKPTLTIDQPGFRELDEALGDLGKTTAKRVMRRGLLQVGQPIADDYAENLKPYRFSGALHDSAAVSTKLTRRQAALNRKAERRSYVEAYIGAGGLPQAHLEEFGTENTPPRPALRTAWDQGWRAALDSLGEFLWAEIRKAVARAERRAAKRLAKGGR